MAMRLPSAILPGDYRAVQGTGNRVRQREIMEEDLPLVHEGQWCTIHARMLHTGPNETSLRMFLLPTGGWMELSGWDLRRLPANSIIPHLCGPPLRTRTPYEIAKIGLDQPLQYDWIRLIRFWEVANYQYAPHFAQDGEHPIFFISPPQGYVQRLTDLQRRAIEQSGRAEYPEEDIEYQASYVPCISRSACGRTTVVSFW